MPSTWGGAQRGELVWSRHMDHIALAFMDGATDVPTEQHAAKLIGVTELALTNRMHVLGAAMAHKHWAAPRAAIPWRGIGVC